MAEVVRQDESLRLPEPFADRDGRVVFVPSEAVVVRRLAIPKVSRRQAERMARYAIEDSLAEDVDALHIHCRRAAKQSGVDVLAARRDDIASWTDWCVAARLAPRALLPDFYALPVTEGGCSVRIDGQRALVRTAQDAGFAVDSSALVACLGRPPDARDGRRLAIDGIAPDSEMYLALAANGWQVEPLVDSTGGELPSPGLLAKPVGSSGTTSTRLFVIAAAVLLLAGAVETASLAYRYLHTQDQVAALETALLERFRATFPAVGRIVDAEGQATLALQQLQAERQRQSRGFVALYAKLVAALPAYRDLQLSRVEFANDRLHARLVDPAAKSVPAFLATLRASGVKAEQVDGGVRIAWN